LSGLIGPSRRVGWVLAVSFLLFARPALADPKLARQHYEIALEALQAGELRKAQTSFEAAYRASPHYLVLYNLGRVSFELGERERARDYFERYLEEGGDAISPDERKEVLALIAHTRTDADPGVEPAPPEPSRAPSPASSATIVSPANAGVPLPRQPSHESASKAQLARERQTTLAVAMGATGAAISAVGAGILIWNDGRREDYEAEQQRLQSAPRPVVDSQEDLDRVIDYTKDRERNEANLESVRRVDSFAWVTLGVGAALMATGVVLYLTRTDEVGLAVGSRQTELFVRVQY
jgi:tetratricopeptide (TPR) repeat protein